MLHDNGSTRSTVTCMIQYGTGIYTPSLNPNQSYIHTIESNTVEPPNKGQVGDNINSAVVSFVERLFKMY